jgi:uncharacterized protein (UPF0335 family)
MQSLSDNKRKAVLGEVLADELKVIMEYVAGIPRIERKVATLEKDMKEVKSDVKVIKTVVTDMGRELKDHDKRLTRLEAAQP